MHESAAEIDASCEVNSATSMGPTTRRVLVLLVASAFGPYLAGGVRTDQVAVYGVACCSSIALLTSPGGRDSRFILRSPAGLGLVSWGVLALVAAISSMSVFEGLPYARGSVVAGLDNLLTPIAVAISVHLMARRGCPAQMVKLIAGVTALLCSANAMLALAQALDAVPQRFVDWWSPPLTSADDMSVADLAGQLGRFSGVFNQPAEAGLAYSVAAVCAVYAFAHRPAIRSAALLLIALGGVLCVSKTFIFVGAPVAIWMLLRGGVAKILSLLVLAGVGTWVVVAGPLSGWEGRGYFLRLFSVEGGGLLNLLSAGRFGNDSSLHDVSRVILETSPLAGTGVGGLATPYDNGWIEALVVAGVIGVVLYTATVGCLALAALRLPVGERTYAVALTVVLVGASLGLPALTANRSGVLLWLTLLPALYVSRYADVRARDDHG